MGSLHGDVVTRKTISRWILLRMRNILDKSRREKQNTHFCLITIFWKSCRFWDNVEKYCAAWGVKNDVTIWHIRVTCWISKATHTRARAHTQTYNDYCHDNNGFVNAPHCYVIRILCVLFFPPSNFVLLLSYCEKTWLFALLIIPSLRDKLLCS